MAGDKSTVSLQTDTTEQILQWYSKLFSRRVDLVGDFAGSERFLIHGESLLLHCFSDAQIDFEPGLQLLHASYAVEKFLHGLVSRRCNFHIAFFDEYQDLCVPQDASPAVSEKYLLARAAIIRHLQVNLRPVHPDIEVKLFSSTTSEAFEEYLRTTDVYFILCHDGASTKDVRKRGILQKDLEALKAEDQSLHERHEQYKSSLRTLIYGMMQRGYSTALVNGLEFQDTKAIASVLEHSRAMTLTIAQTTPASTLNAEVDTTTLQKSLATIKSSNEHAFTEREYLAVLVAANFASKTNGHQDFAVALLRHVALLSDLSLHDRLLQYQEPSHESRALTVEFCQEARKILVQTAWIEEADKSSAACDIADLIDGRLLASCLQTSSSADSDLFQYLAKAASALCGQQGLKTNSATSLTGQPNGDLEKPDEGTSYRLLPFANEVFDKHLAPVHLKVAKSEGKVDSTSAVIFREVTHWHNTKPLQSKSGPIVKDEKAAKKALRRNQFFMAEMTTYAASLTNAVGRALEPETIHVGASKPSTPVPSRPGTPSQDPADRKGKKQGGKPGGKNKNQAKQDMLANIAASSKKKDEETAEKITKAWVVFCDGLEKQADLTSRYEKAKKYLVNLNTDIKRKALEAEVRFYMLNVLLKMWIEHCRKDDKEEGLYTAALIFDAIRAICGLPSVTKTIAACLKKTIDRMKLPSLQVPPTEGDRKLTFAFVLDETSTADLALGLSPEEFQLLYCGPYFDRTMDSAPDPRVPFEPDAWQRKVLDEIDARRSLLVVAPTSAGKTFISFYAMKQVLESNNEDVLVYVAPTKALVNQIAAEVQARFSKNYKYANSVWGIHTRDTRVNNPTGCQILVTVPHILQIMLLAPTNAKGWSERVRWIIFDEVHCIGQAEDGLIWEQLLLMAPCPIIALSATVGNAEAFSDWLSSTQKAAGNDLTMVQHKHRYSDLRKFLYIPPKDAAKRVAASLPLSNNRTFARLGLDDVQNFTFMHPVASLTNRRRGIPSDFSLEARDCYFLWQSMSKHQTKEYPVDKSLTPSAVLPKVMRKADIISWESGLKALLAEWIADDNSPFEAVRKDFSTSVNKSALQIQDGEDSAPKDDLEIDDPASNHDVDNILPLLTELHQQDALPAIIFNYDRAVCERMCRTVLTQLEEAEAEWKRTSPKWAEKLREWEEYKKEVARRAKQGVRAAKGTTKEEQMMEAANREVSPFATFNPDRPLEGFHFANNKKLSNEEILSQEKELRYRGVDEVLIQGLQRGVGVHHAGMNRKYRYAVEVLFRRGYLRVVIATGTLALGINMPCKTVVFSGDSIFLTALNYRQAAGRAGRRGFDSLGNVVFHGVSLSKINKLISSRLPDLNGHFPITTSLVLRLFTLLNDSENSPFAVRCVNALLSQPRVYLGGEESKMTVLHHLRFSIEYLRRQSLLDAQGAPLNFAGAVSHLYFTENSAFAFHALLKNGYFHELCNRVNTNQESVLRELMLTMSHLFGRLHCRQADEEFVQEVVKGSPSVVFLPDMPENAVSVLHKHNKQTLDIFTSYVRTFVEQHIHEPDNTLPLTTTAVGGNSNKGQAPHKVRSSFVALSGHDDTFTSIHDLCTTSRSGVFLEEAVVPFVGIYPEDSDLPLNAYLYDFFMHGNADAVVAANRIRRGDIWFVLNDFSMVLATIVTSLTNFMNLGTESDLDFIDVRGGGDDDEEDLEDRLQGVGEDQQGPQTGSQGARGPAQQQTLPVQLAKKKKKVVDSWDEEAESESSEGENWDDGEDSEEEAGEVAWDEKTGLLNVLKAFKLLKADFDTKFRAMWA